MAKEIEWFIGQDSYNRQEVESMLQTQRAMIHNDVKMLLIEQAEAIDLKGKLTKNGNEIMKFIRNCRKVHF